MGTTSKRVCSVIEEGRKAFFKSDQGGSVNPNNSALRLSVLAAEPHPASAAPVPAIPGLGGHEQHLGCAAGFHGGFDRLPFTTGVGEQQHAGPWIGRAISSLDQTAAARSASPRNGLLKGEWRPAVLFKPISCQVERVHKLS